MMVAVVRNFLLLLVIFLTTGQKGLLNAEICSKSAETIRPVKKCPANETEWNKAAKRKNCSKIQKNDNCTEVEYHCLVNEIRKNFIEVCTKSRIIQKGYCLMYSKNKAKTDWLNYCANQTSCNCSRDGYLSTMAYKWQCCYNGANILPNKNRRGDSVKDQSNNEHLEIWLPLLVLFIVAAAGYVGCVYYGKKLDQNKTFFEALKIWKNVPCTSSVNAVTQRSSDIRRNEKDERTDDAETRPLFEAIEDVSRSLASASPNENSSNQGITAPNTPEKIVSSDPETPVLNKSPEDVSRSYASASPNENSSNQGITAPNTPENIVSPDPETPVLNKSPEDVSRLLAFASPNENSSNQGITAPNTPKKMMSSAPETPVLNKSPEDVSRSLAFASPNENSSNQGITAPNTPEKIVSSCPETPVINTLVDDVPRQSRNENSSNQGITANTQEEILHLDSETTVLNTSPEVILRSLTAESRNKDSSNIGTSALDSLQPSVSASQTTREEISRSELTTGGQIVQQSDESDFTYPGMNKETPNITIIGDKVDWLEKQLVILKKEINTLCGTYICDLIYKLKSMEMKINNINRDLHVCGKTGSGGLHFKQAIQELDKRATKLCNDLVEMRKNLREAIGGSTTDDDLRMTDDDDERPDSRDKHTTEPDGNNTNQTNVPTDKLLKVSKSIALEKSNGASSTDEMASFEKQALLKKEEYLGIQIEKLLPKIRKMSDDYFEGRVSGRIPKQEYRLSGIEADIQILSDLYGFDKIQGSDSGKCLEKTLEDINSSFEKIREMYEQLKCKVY